MIVIVTQNFVYVSFVDNNIDIKIIKIIAKFSRIKKFGFFSSIAVGWIDI